VEALPTGCRHAHAGIVSGLWRYPVKSMAGEAVASTEISWAGLAGDRRWAFVRASGHEKIRVCGQLAPGSRPSFLQSCGH